MSGIAGVYHTDGRPAGEELDRMLGAMEHRGPDGTTAWRDGSVGLGHLMLETTPEDQYESLPLVDRSGNFAITADARIDNRDELIHKLDVRKPDDRPVTDTELILAAYKRWGRDCPKQLLGAFAFAVWDARDRTLTLVRDHFGIQPLYYAHQSGRFFAFSSEEKGLLRTGFSEGNVNDLKVADFLMMPVKVGSDATFWEDILSVPRAHTLQVTVDETVTCKKYWALDPSKETNLGSDAAYIERFRELFREAVRCRMRRTTPLGSTLSGGLDSTSVACTAAQELTDGRLHTLSAVYPSIPEADEREYQEAALDMYRDKMVPTFVTPADTGPLRHQDWFTRYLDHPNDGINAFILIELYRRAAEKNHRVVLSGNDGDTVVSHGRAYYNELLWSFRWWKLSQEIRESVRDLGGDRENLKRSLKGWAKHYLRHSTLTKPLVGLWRAVRDGTNSSRAGDLEMRSEGGGWERGWQKYFDDRFLDVTKPYLDERSSPPEWSRERHHHHMLLTRPLMEGAFRKYDALGAGLGLDIRFPFHDVRLVEFCLSLPGHVKRRREWSRWIEHAAMEGTLPRKVQQRKDKTDVRWVYIHGLENHDDEKLKYFSETMKNKKTKISKYINDREISDLASKMATGDLNNHSEESERILLWRVLSLHNWLEQWANKTPTECGLRGRKSLHSVS